MRRDATVGMSDAGRLRLEDMMERARFELLPLSGALRHARSLPDGAEVAVTADPALGMEPTIDLAVGLAGRGLEVVPHLAARSIADRATLLRHLDRLGEAGVRRALVVGGAAESHGEFFDAAGLLEALGSVDHRLTEVGIGGYPEGHHVLDEAAVHRALVEKAASAAWITTQICFSSERIGRWVRRLRDDGVELPIWLGVPAVADLTGLMSVGLRVGAGRSLQFMFEHPRLVTRLLRPGAGKATDLVVRLAELAADEDLGIAGFHLFSYNQVAASERWRRRVLGRL